MKVVKTRFKVIRKDTFNERDGNKYTQYLVKQIRLFGKWFTYRVIDSEEIPDCHVIGLGAVHNFDGGTGWRSKFKDYIPKSRGGDCKDES